MNNTTLKQLYSDHAGKLSDKWEIYLETYNRVFDVYRDLPISILEIGIQNGGSLDIWSKFFPYAKSLVGCDINPNCSRLKYDDERIKVVVKDANSDVAQSEIIGFSSSFDIIIDDGSHLSSDIIKSFIRYFPHLQEGGVFVAEDLHCSYWEKFEGGLFDPFSSIAFFKRLIDIVNREHWGVDKSITDILRGFINKYNLDIDEKIFEQIHSVEFVNSMCIIRKALPAKNLLGARIIGGSIEAVVPGHLELALKPMRHPRETSNLWSSLKQSPEEGKIYYQIVSLKHLLNRISRKFFNIKS